jgi:hypothetical protein
MSAREATVVAFPTEMKVATPSRWELDDWGRDSTAVQIANGLALMRWSVSLGGAEHVPEHGGALVVASSRRFAQTVPMVAWALQRETGRVVRFVGRPELAPMGPFVQRLGGLRVDAAEVATALTHGEVVVVGTRPVRQTRRAGFVPEDMIGAALTVGVPVFPAAAVSTPFSRTARVELGAQVRPLQQSRGPLGPLELSEQVRRRLQGVLDELGGIPVLDLIGEV